MKRGEKKEQHCQRQQQQNAKKKKYKEKVGKNVRFTLNLLLMPQLSFRLTRFNAINM